MTSRRSRLPTAFAVVATFVCLAAWLALLFAENTYDQPYNRVEDGLYIGGSVEKPPRGTKAVANLCGRPDPYHVDAELWDPVGEAGVEPTLDWLRRVVAFVAEQRAAGRQTYIHCMNGVNRSAGAVTGYLMLEHGWGRDEALAFLQKQRPEVRPSPELMRILAEWERELKTSP
jgi:hypothetical protein